MRCHPAITSVIESHDTASILGDIHEEVRRVQELQMELREKHYELATKNDLIEQQELALGMLRQDHHRLQSQVEEVAALNRREVKYLLGAVIASGMFVLLLCLLAFHVWGN